MGTCRVLGWLGVVAAAVGLTACANVTDGSPQGVAGGPATSGSSAGSTGSTGPTAPGTPANTATLNAATLGAAMKQASGRVTSAQISLAVTGGGTNITGHGSERLAAGKVSALDISEVLGSAGSLRLIIVGGRTYVQLPSSLNDSGKPWSLVTPDSSNPVLAELASSLSQIQNSASLDGYSVFAQAASSVIRNGSSPVDGVAATEYSVTVDVSKLPADYPGVPALTQAGLTSLPLKIWLDTQDRPVRVDETISVSGETVQTDVGITDYDQPVTIQAPPAAEVSSN